MVGEALPSILVTGATGKQGGATVEHLLRSGFRVRALTRAPTRPPAERLRALGVDVVGGDFDDPSSLARAMAGVAGVFLISHYWEGLELEVERGIRAAELAAAAGVDHLVFASVAHCEEETGVPHFDTKRRIEERIEALGVPYTFLRPVAFMENWEWPDVRDGIREGTLAWPLSPDTSLQQVSVTDIGAFAALVFQDPERWSGRALEIAADERTMEEIASAFGRAQGREVRYVQVAQDPEDDTAMMRFFEEGGFSVDIEAVRRLRNDLRSFDDYLEEAGWT